MTFIVRHVSSIVAVFTGALVLNGCGGSPPTSPPRIADVAMTVNVTKSTIGLDKFAYVFDIRLDESGGVPANVVQATIQFDNGFGASCNYRPEHLGQNRLPANGTLVMDSLTCGYADGFPAFNVSLQLIVTNVRTPLTFATSL